MRVRLGAGVSRAVRVVLIAPMVVVALLALPTTVAPVSAATAAGELAVQVRDLNGVPTPGVEVSVVDQSDGLVVGNAVTGDSGDVSFVLTPERCYQVHLTAPAGMYFVGGRQTSSQFACTYSADGEVVVVETIPPDFRAELQVQVADQDGEGIADVIIVIERQFDDGSIGEVVAETVTDANGQASTHLGPGCYRVAFTAPDGWLTDAGEPTSYAETCVDGWASNLPAFARFYEDTGLGTVFFITSGLQGSVAGSTLYLRPEVEGDVGDIVATLESGTDLRSVEVPLGCYVYRVEAAPGWLFEENGSTILDGRFCFTGFPNQAWITPSLRSANPMTTVYIEARRSPDFSPAAGLAIDVHRTVDGQDPEFIGRFVTGEAGTVDFQVPPGCYELTYQAPPGYQLPNGEPTQIERTCFSEYDLSVQRFLLMTSGDVEPMLWVGAGTIWGQPVPGVLIDLVDEAGQVVASTQTDETGSVLITVPIGCFEVTATAPAGYTFVDGATSASQRSCVDLGGGVASFTLIDLNTRIPGTLRAILSDQTPVGGVMATVFQLNDDGSIGDVVDVFTTDDVGQVALSFGIGCYRIDVAAPDGFLFAETGDDSTSWETCFTGLEPPVYWELYLGESRDLDSTLTIVASLRDGRRVEGVRVELIRADGSSLNLSTGADGSTSTTLEVGCSTITATTPAGTSFADGSTRRTSEVCVDGSGEPIEIPLLLQRGGRPEVGTCVGRGIGRPVCEIGRRPTSAHN